MHWSPGLKLEAIEKMTILEAYRFYRHNKTTTAESLGISIRTLDSKLEKYHAEFESQRQADEKNKLARREELARAMKVPSQFQIPSSIPNVRTPSLNYAESKVIANQVPSAAQTSLTKKR